MNDDTISRQAAIDAICEHGTDLERRGITVLAVANYKQVTVDLLENLPSAERRGQWKDIPFTARWICSNCDYISEFASFKYCPDCGAKNEDDKRMKLLQVTEQNKTYFSVDYVKGFNDGAIAQYEADKKDAELRDKDGLLGRMMRTINARDAVEYLRKNELTITRCKSCYQHKDIDDRCYCRKLEMYVDGDWFCKDAKAEGCDTCFVPLYHNLEDDDSICRDCGVGE